MEFIILHTLDKRDVHVNLLYIVSVAEPKPADKSTLTSEVHCVVSLVDGKFITVVESCASIRKRLGDTEK